MKKFKLKKRPIGILLTLCLFYLILFIIFLYTGFNWIFGLVVLIWLPTFILFIRKVRTNENKRKVTLFLIIITLVFLIPFLYVTAQISDYKLYWNPYHDSIIPQENFIEIRPIVWSWDSEEYYRLHAKGEVFYINTNSEPFLFKEYMLLIKSKPQMPDELLLQRHNYYK